MLPETAQRIKAKVSTAVEQLPSVGKVSGDSVQLKSQEFGPETGSFKKLFNGKQKNQALESLETLAPEPPEFSQTPINLSGGQTTERAQVMLERHTVEGDFGNRYTRSQGKNGETIYEEFSYIRSPEAGMEQRKTILRESPTGALMMEESVIHGDGTKTEARASF